MAQCAVLTDDEEHKMVLDALWHDVYWLFDLFDVPFFSEDDLGFALQQYNLEAGTNLALFRECDNSANNAPWANCFWVRQFIDDNSISFWITSFKVDRLLSGRGRFIASMDSAPATDNYKCVRENKSVYSQYPDTADMCRGYYNREHYEKSDALRKMFGTVWIDQA